MPEKGSVGASGDLVPLAHMALVLIGKGEAIFGGQRLPGAAALQAVGLAPLRLEAGEGLCLVNGTQAMTAIGALAVYDALRLAKLADIAAATSLEVLMGSRTEFDPRIHRVRPHPGQGRAAENMNRIIRNSEIISSHKDCRRVQDAYTLRCSPQVHGASRDAINYGRKVIKTEMNASTNNPLVFADTGDFLLGGNFHGQPVALAMDFLGIGLAELANISERRVERLVNPMLSGLPAFLVKDGGLNSGFMIAQYVAAALVSENKVLAHPASVDSIPTSANKEDHVSMGTIAAPQVPRHPAQHPGRHCHRTAVRRPGTGSVHQHPPGGRDPGRLPGGAQRHTAPRKRPGAGHRHRGHPAADVRRGDSFGRGRRRRPAPLAVFIRKRHL